MEFLAATYTLNTEPIFAPLIEANSFHSKPSDQDDAGCMNFPETLQMARILFESECIVSSLTMAGSNNSALKLDQSLASLSESVSLLKAKNII
ncbi:hypothetical protein PVL29_018497 [Vitis rotundifolia]|uniref:Uncharacterized protein n=1 Tax=Vitis rotundifolia TaxID=103349 RepID=A0AA38Z5S1_VITRO|nr:hypothetical protein PVL29_018497 [Vitis rotundifolia]